jgi:hypothetical protein
MIVIVRKCTRIHVMLAGIHAQQGDFTTHGLKFLTKVAYGYGFAVF